MRIACLWFPTSAPTSKLAELFLRFSPQICVRKDRAIFVEIGKCRGLYSEASFLARSQILLKRNGCSAQVAIGNELTEALVLAKHQLSSVDQLPLEAILEFVDPFDRDPILRKSVSSLIISFQDLGIKTLGRFKALTANQLISRFGIVGRHCHNRIHYADFIAWPLWVPEELIQESRDFPYFEFYGELDPILFEAKSQLDRIFLRLFSRQRRLTKLRVEIKCEKMSTHPNFLRTMDFDFYTPQSSSKGALRIVKERLSREFERKPVLSPIEGIRIAVLNSVSYKGGQKNLFNADEEKFEQLNSLHNQLVELLGRDNIFQAVLTEDRRPEKSWTKKFDSPHESQTVAFDIVAAIPERSTYLCRYPVKIEVTAGFVHIKKRRYRILNWDNQVEKVSGGWFEKPVEEIKDSFDRNYYQVEIEGHQRISVFETPSREYYLHGYYG